MKRSGDAVWRGGLKEGKGTLSSQSRTLSQVPYSFAQRFGEEAGTNPEELIAAAHAACFSMAFSSELGKLNAMPESIETKATFSFEKTDAGFTVTEIQLDTRARVPGADQATVRKAAEAAKGGCPVSRLLKAPITLNLTVG